MSNNNKKPDNESKPSKFNHYWIYGLILLGIIALNLIPFQSYVKDISEQQFFREYLPSGDVEKLVVVNKELVEVYIKPDRLTKSQYDDIKNNKFGTPSKGPHYYFTIGSSDNFSSTLQAAQKDAVAENVVDVRHESRTDWRSGFFSYLLPFIIIIVIWIFIMRRVSGGVGGPGGQIFNIGKSKATLLDGDAKVDLTFDDVAGLDEAKEEVKEIVDFLKNPQKYTALGGKIPKGVLLIGPPGTGKTDRKSVV